MSKCIWYDNLYCDQVYDDGNCWCQKSEDHRNKTGEKMTDKEARLLLAIGTK